jgi:hypothetical protein
VLPYKLELMAFARYCIVGGAASWLILQIPIESPLLSAIVKASLILIAYAVVLFAIDKHVRSLLISFWNVLTRWLHAESKPVLNSIPAVTERT